MTDFSICWRRATLIAVAAATLLRPTAAAAHEGEESGRAGDLVRQAIALIVNSPADVGGIRDRVADALRAEDTSDVDLSAVEDALAAVDAGDLHQARALLETSIGAQPHVPLAAAEPPPIRETTPSTVPNASGSDPTDDGMPVDETDGGDDAITGAGPMEMATGAEPGDVLVAEPLNVTDGFDGGEWIELALSVMLVVLGIWLGWRYRPAPWRPA